MVARQRRFDLADAGAWPSAGDQVVQDGAADVTGEVEVVGDDVFGPDEQVFGCLQGGGELARS
ncbi:MAG: hypothetical protein ACRDQ7_24575 [Haloechinothrix sp.]